MNQVREMHESLIKGDYIQTGFPSLDKLIGPLLPGRQVVLAARPSVGKSVMATTIGKNLAERGLPGLFLTFEMTAGQQVSRMVCAETCTDTRDILQKLKQPEVAEVYSRVSELPITWNDTHADIGTIRQIIDNLDISWIMVDYLQLCSDQKKWKREEEIRSISQFFKGIAQNKGLVTFVLAQLNRQATEDGGASAPSST